MGFETAGEMHYAPDAAAAGVHDGVVAWHISFGDLLERVYLDWRARSRLRTEKILYTIRLGLMLVLLGQLVQAPSSRAQPATTGALCALSADWRLIVGVLLAMAAWAGLMALLWDEQQYLRTHNFVTCAARQLLCVLGILTLSMADLPPTAAGHGSAGSGPGNGAAIREGCSCESPALGWLACRLLPTRLRATNHQPFLLTACQPLLPVT